MDLFEFRGERRVDLSHGGVPEVEGDLPHRDEVVEVGEVDFAVCAIAGQQYVPEGRVVQAVSQFPQSNGEFVRCTRTRYEPAALSCRNVVFLP